MRQGPNVRKLIVHKMSLIMAPVGGGMAGALASLVRPGGISDAAVEATRWVEQVIALIKSAHDNPYGDDDEAIAGAILAGIEAKKKRS